MMYNLVLQSYGSTKEYHRAILCIWSFFVHYREPLHQCQVLIFSDNPSFFDTHLKGLPVQFAPLSEKKIEAMRGPIDFVHHVKIAVIEEAFNLLNGDILYVDSDTFFTSDPLPYFKLTTAERVFMHRNEYLFESMQDLPLPSGQTFHDFYRYISARPFVLSNGNEIIISPKQISWNAGVILLHSSHRALLNDVYKLTQSLYLNTQHNGCEQYAFSIILGRNAQIRECTDMVYHYWPVVEKNIMDRLMSDIFTNVWLKENADERLKRIKRWTSALPLIIEQHPLMFRYKAIQEFNIASYRRGYSYALLALMKAPFNWQFIKDVTYHTFKARH